MEKSTNQGIHITILKLKAELISELIPTRETIKNYIYKKYLIQTYSNMPRNLKTGLRVQKYSKFISDFSKGMLEVSTFHVEMLQDLKKDLKVEMTKMGIPIPNNDSNLHIVKQDVVNAKS